MTWVPFCSEAVVHGAAERAAAVRSLLALLEETLHSRLSHIKQLYGLKGLDLRFLLGFESVLRRNLLAEPFSFLRMTFTIEHPNSAGRHHSYITRTMDTQWRHKSKKSENLGQYGRQNMLRPHLKIWEWEWIFGHSVKEISSQGVRSPCCIRLSLPALQRQIFC